MASSDNSTIEVVINNRNRLTTTKELVENLLRLNPDEKIIIIDNGSKYPPLLDWYNNIRSYVDVRMNKNDGHLAVWATRLWEELGEYFVYTDSDIQVNPEFPVDWKEIMLDYGKKYDVIKVALALRLDDIPNHYRYKNQVLRNEARWWLNQLEPDVYTADTDTTFSLIKNNGDNCYNSVRLAHKNLIARHVPWYYNLDTLNEEERYYLENHEARFHTQYTIQHVHPNKFLDI
jgi:glycosyltransferase involved in cell wall biosynthesis